MGDLFGLHVQAYPKYGSSKKGLPTTYYLTVAPSKIHTHCELEHVEFVALNDVNAFNLENPLLGISQNGMVFTQSNYTDPKEIWDSNDWSRGDVMVLFRQAVELNNRGLDVPFSERG